MELRDMSDADIATSGKLTVYGHFAAQVRRAPDAIAMNDGGTLSTYRDLDHRVRRLAASLMARGVSRGDRIALLSENRREYIEIELAAALLGAIVACQNWRLAQDELKHCITLVDPCLAIVSPRYGETFAALDLTDIPLLSLGANYDDAINAAPALAELPDVDPEDGLVILYTSGTTGLPKGALISHRAEIARMTVMRMDFGLSPQDGFLAWAPMFHMGSTDQVLATLMFGAVVHIVDGFDAAVIVGIMENYPLGWMLLMPGTIEPVVEIFEKTGRRPKSIRAIGAMADLVPKSLIKKLSGLSNAPYLNSFGSTETGLPPGSAMLFPPGSVPETLAKRQSSLCDLRLVDPDGKDVPDGEAGEAAVRGPTIFSGYWNAPEVNSKDFRDGWFRMGDLFRRVPCGGFEFVDRAKYMIKSGGENIYPAEIERVLLADPRVREAVVVRMKDAHWGEVPAAFIARTDETLDEAAVEAMCRQSLAGYKRPKAVRFIDYEAFPRSTTGKVLRHEIEGLV
jgi:fatty-acyl-CoA synthase